MSILRESPVLDIVIALDIAQRCEPGETLVHATTREQNMRKEIERTVINVDTCGNLLHFSLNREVIFIAPVLSPESRIVNCMYKRVGLEDSYRLVNSFYPKRWESIAFALGIGFEPEEIIKTGAHSASVWDFEARLDIRKTWADAWGESPGQYENNK